MYYKYIYINPVIIAGLWGPAWHHATEPGQHWDWGHHWLCLWLAADSGHSGFHPDYWNSRRSADEAVGGSLW